MKNGLKKLWPALAAFTTLASVTCSADDMQMRNIENRVSALEQRRGANGMINPPARPVVRDGIDLWAQVEALYMHATEDGLAYAIRNNDSNFPVSVDGNVKNVKYHWNWGFRAGLGYNLPHDGWDVLLNWTWFRSHQNVSKKNTPANLLATQAAPLFANTFYNTAKGALSLHFNLLDFELGREFFVSKWLTLRPFVGARVSWLNRNFQTKYALFEGTSIKIKGHDHNRFRGGGLRAGLDTQWGLGCGWSFFGDLALSLLYGTQRLHSHQDVNTSGTKTRIQHAHDHWLTVRPMLDLAAGLRWDHLFGNCDAYRIRIQLGWEQTTMFGFGKDLNFVNSSAPGKYTFNNGDLAVSGVSLQFRFDF